MPNNLTNVYHSPSLFSSSMPPPESGAPLIPVGFAVFNRRVMQLASRGKCDRARAGSSLVHFEGTVFFFLVFSEKSYARATRKKENNNSGLICSMEALVTVLAVKKKARGRGQEFTFVLSTCSYPKPGLKKEIVSFCLGHHVIPNSQLGFMHGRSTV